MIFEPGRYIVAMDRNGIHIRRTLCVIHRAEQSEVHYHTSPIFSFDWDDIPKFLDYLDALMTASQQEESA